MRLFAAAAIVVAAIAAHFYAMDAGIYVAQLREGTVWFDNVLHACAGIATGLVWISFLKRFKPDTSFFGAALTLLAVVALAAVVWEAFEYAFYLVFKSGALGLTVYEPSIQESLFDSASNIGGAMLLLAAWALLRRLNATAE